MLLHSRKKTGGGVGFNFHLLFHSCCCLGEERGMTERHTGGKRSYVWEILRGKKNPWQTKTRMVTHVTGRRTAILCRRVENGYPSKDCNVLSIRGLPQGNKPSCCNFVSWCRQKSYLKAPEQKTRHLFPFLQFWLEWSRSLFQIFDTFTDIHGIILSGASFVQERGNKITI